MGQLLDEHRAYLRLLSQRQLGPQLNARLDASDLVQKTCLAVVRDFEQFRGATTEQFMAWLLRVHERTIHETIRGHVGAERRAVNREEPLAEHHLDDAAQRHDRQASPSCKAQRREAAAALAKRLERLPDDQREAVRLRYLEGRSVAEIAEHLQRSPGAVASLVYRGLENLRRLSNSKEN